MGAGNALGAGKYPEKPITLIVHAGAGGGSDIFARTLSAAFEKEKLLPQPIVVENKPGGSGAIAFAYVAGKKKDPYFLLTAVTSFMTTPLMGLTPVGLKDFTPIANFAFDEYMLMVNPKSKYKSVKEIIADAKANPEEDHRRRDAARLVRLHLRLPDRKGGRRPVQLHRLQRRRRGQCGPPRRPYRHGGQQPRRGAGTLQGGQGQDSSASLPRSAWPAPPMSRR